MNKKKKKDNFIIFLEKLCLTVYKELGDGFDEDIYQRSLAYEFRKKGIHYMRETNIETFYKDQMLTLRELDFVIPAQKNKIFDLPFPLIIECKYNIKIDDKARSQLRQYLKSLPKNSNPEINTIDTGILLNWTNKNIYKDKRIVATEPISIELWRYKDKSDMELLFKNEESYSLEYPGPFVLEGF